MQIYGRSYRLIFPTNSYVQFFAGFLLSLISTLFPLACSVDSADIPEAVRTGNQKKLREGLDGGLSPNYRDNNSNTLLHVAVLGKQKIIAQLLIDKGARVNSTNIHKATPLMLAADANATNMLQFLFRNNAKPDLADVSNRTALVRACAKGHTASVEILLENKADANWPEYRLTPLQLAVQSTNTALARLLLEHEADPGLFTAGTASPLILAIRSGEIALIRKLIDAGAHVNASRKAGTTPLIESVQTGKMELVNLLLRRGASLNAVTTDGMTPLIAAAGHGDHKMAAWLLEHGAGVNKAVKAGEVFTRELKTEDTVITPLTAAITNRDLKTVKLLVHSGANINQYALGRPSLLSAIGTDFFDAAFFLAKRDVDFSLVDKDRRGYGDIMFAAVNSGNRQLVGFLIDKGAAINDNINYAVYSEDLEMVRLLVEKGARVYIKNPQGPTPLIIALQHKQKEMSRYLFKIQKKQRYAAQVKDFSDEDKSKKDYFSIQWAKYMYAHPGGLEADFSTMEVCVQKSLHLQKKGFREYKNGNDRKALEYYEKALSLHATPGIYYNYANSLSNIPRLEDSIQAYRIALKLKHPESYLVLYNMACAYSRMEEAEEAFTALKRAVEEGYGAFSYMEEDRDLAFLRKQPGWKNRLGLLNNRYFGTMVKHSHAQVFKKLYMGKKMVSHEHNLYCIFIKTKNTSKYSLGRYSMSFIDLEKGMKKHSTLGSETGDFRLDGNYIHLLQPNSYVPMERNLPFKPAGPKSVYIDKILFKVVRPVNDEERRQIAH